MASGLCTFFRFMSTSKINELLPPESQSIHLKMLKQTSNDFAFLAALEKFFIDIEMDPTLSDKRKGLSLKHHNVCSFCLYVFVWSATARSDLFFWQVASAGAA